MLLMAHASRACTYACVVALTDETRVNRLGRLLIGYWHGACMAILPVRAPQVYEFIYSSVHALTR